MKACWYAGMRVCMYVCMDGCLDVRTHICMYIYPMYDVQRMCVYV